MSRLFDSITTIKGIGPKRAALYKKLGIASLLDAVEYFPREYEERGAVQPISSIQEGMEVSLCVLFDSSPRVQWIKKGFSTTILNGHDSSGRVECIWFNQPFRGSLYKQNHKYFIRGKVEKKPSGMQIQNPIVEEYNQDYHHQDRLLPIYRLTNGLTQRDLRNLTQEAIKYLVNISDELDIYVTQHYGLIGQNEAYNCIHYPESTEQIKRARQRLAFDEFFTLQVAVKYIRAQIKDTANGIMFPINQENIDNFLSRFPFELTDSQHKVLAEVLADLSSGFVMNRLIQGDVGSGKTAIAAAALYTVASSGFQCTMMAPTEILAKQHLNTLTWLMKDTNIRIALLTGSMKETDKKSVKSALATGEIDILLGTHAIIQEDVIFNKLGLVITDEQHRFGVRQRTLLQYKGTVPHILVMSATPIPRTLAHILHGDLDLSVIDALPPGRIPIKTFHIQNRLRERAYSFVKKQVVEGSQAYVVCPLVEESEKLDLMSAAEVYNKLSQGYLSDVKLALLHGKLRPQEKEKIMEAFVAGEIQVLVSTTVIEVGVNVPNATIMVIENAERFGLAQLHQLRGRVGRGDKPSYCILISDTKDQTTKARMKVLVDSTDGFEIAEKDLELRGPGDLFGVRQHGIPDFKMANPLKDSALFKLAQEAADIVIENSNNEINKAFIQKSLEKFNQMTEGFVSN